MHGGGCLLTLITRLVKAELPERVRWRDDGVELE